jgi:amino acid transporter
VKRKKKLGALQSTAICGNDITSSCLYVSALSIIYAGKWAVIALLMVAGVLYLYRNIYAEVVGALPLNGGAYNALLNTTSKRFASVAACLTILSYMATAVISASEAMHYVHTMIPSLDVILATIGLLAAFMTLNLMGIRESAAVATVIFIVHISSLVLLLVVGISYLTQNGLGTILANLDQTGPHSMSKALFFGFAAAMLGISGFESSANFVEEQDDGVFPKTLNYMWLAVSFFNPVIAILILAIIPISEVAAHQEALLSYIGLNAGGTWLSTLISVDAAIVLSGAVLTSYVGITGLIQRMTLDRCLPQLLLKLNRRKTPHFIVISFFILCVSVLLITKGELSALAGVYTISFLSVMTLFALGNLLLKVRRAGLPRPTIASWPLVVIAFTAVIIAITGNIVLNPSYFFVFLEYFIPSVIFVMCMLGRIAIFEACLFVIRSINEKVSETSNRISTRIFSWIDDINSQQMVFFTKGDDIANLNRVMMYVQDNEHTSRIKIVTVLKDGENAPAKLKTELEFLDRAYPEIDIEFVTLKGEFGPTLIEKLSKDWSIPSNFMFIGSPADRFPFRIAELRGVRLII